MARGSGFAFRDKRTGKFYAVVSVGRGERIAKPCLLSPDLDDARQRASIAAGLVNALREAHRDTPAIVETTVEECARVPLDKMDDVRAMVGQSSEARYRSTPREREGTRRRAARDRPLATSRSYGPPVTCARNTPTSWKRCRRRMRRTSRASSIATCCPWFATFRSPRSRWTTRCA